MSGTVPYIVSYIVEKLQKAGADVSQADYIGWTAFLTTSRNGLTEAVEKLLEAGVDVNQGDYIGWTAFHHASWFGYPVIVEILLMAGANINQAPECGSSPLFIASEQGHTEVVEKLLRAGAYVKQANRYNNTALDAARSKNKEEVVALLEEWPKVMTLRTLCQNAITRNCIKWRDFISPVLMEPIDEVAEKECQLERTKEIKAGSQAQ